MRIETLPATWHPGVICGGMDEQSYVIVKSPREDMTHTVWGNLEELIATNICQLKANVKSEDNS